MHNNETKFLISMFSTHKFFSPFKWINALDAIRMYFIEKRFISSIDKIACISIREKNDLQKEYPKKNITWIPPFTDFKLNNSNKLNKEELIVYNQLSKKTKIKK